MPYKANDLVDRLTWRVPSVKVLMNSPAVQALRVVARQFPLLAVPSVVDDAPRMRAVHAGWPQWVGKR